MAGDIAEIPVIPVIKITPTRVGTPAVKTGGANYGAGYAMPALSNTQLGYDMGFSDPNSPLYVGIPLKARPYNFGLSQEEKYGNTYISPSGNAEDTTSVEKQWDDNTDYIDQVNKKKEEKIAELNKGVATARNDVTTIDKYTPDTTKESYTKKDILGLNLQRESGLLKNAVQEPLALAGKATARVFQRGWEKVKQGAEDVRQMYFDATMTPQEQYAANQELMKRKNDAAIKEERQAALGDVKLAEDMVNKDNAELSKAQAEADAVMKKSGKNIEDTTSAIATQEKLDTNYQKNITELEKKRQDLQLIKDAEGTAAIEEQQRKAEEEYTLAINKNTYHYVSGKENKSTNIADFNAQVAAEFNLKDGQEVGSFLNSKQQVKFNEAVIAEQKLGELNTRFMDNSVKNVEAQTTKVYEKFFQNNSILLNDNDTKAIESGLYSGVVPELEKARAEGPEALNVFMQKWSKINQLGLDTLSTLGINKGILSAGQGRDDFIKIISGGEFDKVKKDILGMDPATLTDENGNFDMVKFGTAIAELDSFKAYRDLVGVSTMESKGKILLAGAKDDNWATRAIKRVGFAYDEGTYSLNENVFQPIAKYFDAQYDLKKEVGMMSTSAVASRMLLGESIYGNTLDSYIKNIKREDITYAQRNWNTMGDTIDATWKTLKSNPATAAAIAATSYIAMAGLLTKAPAVLGIIETLDNVAHPVRRNLLKGVTYGLANTVESLPLNIVMDSAFAVPGENMAWWLADPLMGFASIAADANAGRLITRVQKDVNDIRKHAIAGDELINNVWVPKKGAKQLVEGTQEFQDAFILGIQQKYGRLVEGAEQGGVSVIDYMGIGNTITKDTSRTIAKSIANNINRLKLEDKLPEIIMGAALESKLKFIDKFTPETITMMTKSYKAKAPELARTIEQNLIKKGEYTEFNFVRDMQVAERSNVQTIAELQLKKLSDMQLTETKMFEGIEGTYARVNEKIEKLKSTGTEAEKAFASAAKADLDEWLALNYQLPYQLSNEQLAENIGKIKERAAKLVTEMGMGGEKGLVTSIEIPQEILDAKGDIEKITKIIYGDMPKYEKLGVKTYNATEYIAQNEIVLKSLLGEEKYNRLSSLMGIISKVNNGDMQILELPSSIQDAVVSVGGFVTQTEVGAKRQFIVGVMGTLAETTLSSNKKIKSYFEVLCHELGHNILFSLNKEIRTTLMKNIVNTFSAKGMDLEATIKELADLSEERRNFLYSLYKFDDKAEFYEEISADVIGSSLISHIYGDNIQKLNPGKTIHENLLRGKIGFDIEGKDAGNKIAKLFVDAITGMRKHIAGGRHAAPIVDTRVILHTIADAMLEGNMGRTKNNAIGNMKKFGFLKFEGLEEVTYDFAKVKMGTRDVEMIPINILDKYKEFDRAVTPGISSPDYIDGLRYNIETYGIKEPLILAYYKGDKTTKLIEGNTRLMIAKEMGMNELPVRVISYEGKGGKGAVSVKGVIGNEHGFIPEDLLPSDIGINQTMLLRDGQRPIGADYFTDITARERFNIPNLNLLSNQGSDRTVFDIGNGKIVKVAKTARGLTQNAQASWDLVEAGIIPRIFEIGDNYVVFEKVKTFQEVEENITRLKSSKFWVEGEGLSRSAIPTSELDEFDKRKGELVKELGNKYKLDNVAEKAAEYSWNTTIKKDFVDMEDFLNSIGWEHLMNYDIDKFGRGDVRFENLGIKDGKVMLIDEGTVDLMSTLVTHRGIDSMTDEAFRKIYDESKAFKEEMMDKDSYTYFRKTAESKSYEKNADKIDASHDSNIFSSAELTNPSEVRAAVKSKKVTYKELGAALPIIYRQDINLYGELIKGLNDEEILFLNEAIEFSSQKHNLAIGMIRQAYSAAGGYIDLTKKIDGYTFAEALNNVGVWVTKQGATERSAGDLIKYLGQADHDTMLTHMMNLEIQGDYYTEAVQKKITEGLDALAGEGTSVGGQYTAFVTKVREKIYEKAIAGGLTHAKATDLARDITSRLVVGGAGYLRVIKDNVGAIVDAPKVFIEEMAAGLTKKNMMYAGEDFIADYRKIIDGFEGTDLYRAEMVSDIFSKEIEKDQIKWARYTRLYYNYLSERTNSYILNALRDGTIKKLAMSTEDFATFMNKISRRGSVYEDLIKEKIMSLGLDKESSYHSDWLNMSRIPAYNSTEELIGIYKAILEENKGSIIMQKTKYQPMKKFLEQLEKTGISKTDNARMIAMHNKNYNAIGDEITAETYFNDLATEQEARDLFNTREANLLGWNDATSTHAYQEGLKTYNSEAVNSLSRDLGDLLSLYNNTIEDAKEVGLNIAVGNLFDAKLQNNPFKSLFEVQGADASIKLIDKINNRYQKEFRFEYEEKIAESKSSFIRKLIGGIVNPATVAKYDDKFKGIMYESIDAMQQGNHIFEGSALESYMVSKEITKKNITTSKFFNYFVEDINKLVGKGKLTFRNISADILSNYEYRYFKSKAQVFQGGIVNRFAIEDQEYKTLIDSYVDILGRRKYDKRGLFSVEELNKVMGDIESAFHKNILFLGAFRNTTKEMNKVEGLKGHRFGMTKEDIAYMKNKANVFHPSMFNNLMYNSYAQTDQAYGFLDKIIKGYKGLEKGSIKLQYALFYNSILGAPAGMQQVFTNRMKMVANNIAEVGSMDIAEGDKFLDLINNIYKVDVIGMGDEGSLLVRGELQSEVLAKGNSTKISKAGKILDTFLTDTSALALGDKVSEVSVKRLSLNAAFNKYGYSRQAANDFVTKMIDISEKLDKEGMVTLIKGDNTYMTFDNFIKKGEKETESLLSYRINKEVAVGNMTMEEGQRKLSEMMRLKQEVAPIKKVIEDIRVNYQVFYQLSNEPQMISNLLGGWAGSSNMRFFNWASRKSGEYAYQMANAILSKNSQEITKLGIQLGSEAMMTAKYYLFTNNVSNESGGGGGINAGEFAMAMFLPAVLFSMLTLRVGPALVELGWDGIKNIFRTNESQEEYTKRIQMQGGTIAKRFIDEMSNLVSGVSKRPQSSALFWFSNIVRINNGLTGLREKGDVSEAVGVGGGIEYATYLASHMIGNIMQGRVSRFDTNTNGGYNSYMGYKQTDSLINMMFNANVDEKSLAFQKLLTYSYKMDNSEYSSSSFLNLAGYGKDKTFEMIAEDRYMKKNGFYQFVYGGTGIRELLEKTENSIKEPDIKALYEAAGIQYNETADTIDYDLFNTIEGNTLRQDNENILNANKALTIGKKSALWNLTMNHLNPSKGGTTQKQLYAMGGGILPADIKAKQDRRTKLVLEIEDEAVKHPELLTQAYLKPQVRRNLITEGVNDFGDAILLGAVMQGMANANVKIMELQATKNYGKDWKTGKYALSEKQKIIDSDAKYKLDLMANNRNTILQANRTIGTDTLLVAINSDPNSPLKVQLKDNIGIGIPIMANLIQKQVSAQGIASFGIDNKSNHILSYVWRGYDYADKEKKGDKLKEVMAFMSNMLDYADDASKGDESFRTNIRVGLIASSVDHLEEMRAASLEAGDGFWESIADDVGNFLKRTSVSEPLEDEEIKARVFDSIFKESGGSKITPNPEEFKKLAFKLNKFADFKTDFLRYVLKEEPLEHITYTLDGKGKITPLRQSALEARPPDAKNEFIKLKTPESLKTADITVETVKTTRTAKYTGKTIKGGNVYTVKTTRGAKKS